MSQQSSSCHQHRPLQTAIESLTKHAMFGPGWKIHLSRKVSAALNTCRWNGSKSLLRANCSFSQHDSRRQWSPQPPCCLDAPTHVSSDCTGPVLRQAPVPVLALKSLHAAIEALASGVDSHWLAMVSPKYGYSRPFENLGTPLTVGCLPHSHCSSAGRGEGSRWVDSGA